MALLSFHVFIEEKVDMVVYETHLGGEFDATNIISAPIVTALTDRIGPCQAARANNRTNGLA